MSKVIADQAYPAWAIAVAAKYAGVDLSVEEDTNVKSKSLTGKGPILETQEGTIFTATAAARYVARNNKQLHGATPFEVAQVDQWCNFASQEIDIPANVWIFPILGLIQNNPAATPAAKADVQKVLEILNKHLETRTFLVGERITLADIVVATSLYRLYTKVLDANFRKAYVNTNRWFSTITNQPEFLAVLPATPLCTKMEVAPANAPKAAKEEKPKEAKPKKEAPKEEKPKDEEEDLEAAAEREAAAEAKKKNPLDALPPSSFVMDEWKRQYSNNDTRTVAIPWFWEHYDPEGYSLWFADYKYNEELEQVFKTCNLMNGFIQRLDKVRKYAFGSLLIFGGEGDMVIKTAWLFRGKEIPADMLECDDSEHYNWTKVDTSNTEHKERINNFWAWDGFTNEKPFNQGKVFK